jgi:hypothetical protein
MGRLGTLTGYPQRVPRQKYEPPNPEVAARIAEVVRLFKEQQRIESEYKKALADVHDPAKDDVPVAHLAEQLGVERKTVYRHLGRSMT